MVRPALPFPVYPPHLARHYQRILDDLVQGRDVVWVFPRGTDRTTHVSNLTRLGSEWMVLETISSYEAKWEYTHTGGQSGAVVSLRLNAESLPETGSDALVLSPQVLALPPELQETMSLERVTVEILPPVQQRRPVLLPLVAPQVGSPLAGRVDLSVRPFWGCTSTMEMRQAAHSWLGEGADLAYGLWATTVWVKLAGFDSGLLFDFIHQRVSPDEWRAFLEEYAKKEGWADSAFVERIAPTLDHPALWHTSVSAHYEDAPPASLFLLWAEGLCDRVVDRGIHIHSALLVVTRRDDLLMHRLWRGQVEALFPVIDLARRAMTKHFKLAPTSDTEPVEFADLQLAAAMAPGDRLSGELKALVSDIHRARNELAHYKCLTWDDFQTIVAALVRLYQALRLSGRASADHVGARADVFRRAVQGYSGG